MQIATIIANLFIKKTVDKATKAVSKLLKEKEVTFKHSYIDIENSISKHLQQIITWSDEINFKDISSIKRLADIFINIDIYLMPQKLKLDNETLEKIPSKSLFSHVDHHIVLLGQPGAGKTTLMKNICQAVILDEKYNQDKFKIPIIIRLRELNASNIEKVSLLNILFDVFGLILSKNAVQNDNFDTIKQNVVISLLEAWSAIIILDGYDEISDANLKKKILEEFRTLTLTLCKSRIILTSRSSDYNYSIDNVEVLEICPLNNKQILDFATKWLIEKEKIDSFISDLNKSPFLDTTMRPLTLAHLCAIFERSGRIPEKPKTVYRKIVNLLLEEWDEQRGVKRISQYSQFDVDRKSEFLSWLSYELTISYNKSVFDKDDIKHIYSKIHLNFGLQKNDIKNVVQEIETHNGLILQVGIDSYEFAHKSIQEYLTSEHLVKLPNIPRVDIYSIPNELAIAIAISSNPSDYFSELVVNHFCPTMMLTEEQLRKRKQLLRNSNRAFNIDILYKIDKDIEIKDSFIRTFVNRLVLEKPDFNNSEVIGLALVILFTLYKQIEIKQPSLFYQPATLLFENFLELIFKRNKLNINKYYSRTTKAGYTEENYHYYELHSTTDQYTLPKLVFVKPEFIFSSQ
ncbi:MAG: hypothetical protein JWQ38_1105 [Flavipsychrobacter sp.]|nr:hypothetical protein [Flavipsychrobacter sp.]